MAHRIGETLDGLGDADDESEAIVEDDSNKPQDDDYFIQNERRGGYYVSQKGKVIRNFQADDYADIERFIWQHMEKNQFWPNVWRVGERGDTDLVIIKPPKAVKFDLDGLPRKRRGVPPSWARPSRRR